MNKGSKGFYIGESEENPLAEMTFSRAGEKIIIIDSTYVSDELRGQGAGKLLLSEMVDWARKEEKKIMPLCPFAKAEMQKNRALYEDVLY